MSRWNDLLQLFAHPSPFPNETGGLPNGYFEPGSELLAKIQTTPILILGAGGLGCELLKDFALSGFQQIHVIDMDTIDVSNLNRQFLFRKKDVGQSKAEVAAAFIEQRVPDVQVTPHYCKLQDKDDDFFLQFALVVSGLDNIQARQWMNAKLCSFVEMEENEEGEEVVNPDTVIPFIDGGTEGFKGQARVILPGITSCFECSISSFPPQKSFPLCTIAEIPRLPEHCISYAFMIEWSKNFDRPIDKDSPEDMTWVFERAVERANDFGIEGVTYSLTLGVVKNIIPAIASTNAIVAAACVNEALKILSFHSQTLNTYYMYMGNESIYGQTFVYHKLEDCPVCNLENLNITLSFPQEATVQELLDALKERFSLENPALTTEGTSIFFSNPPSLFEQTKSNLERPISDFTDGSEDITLSDPILTRERYIRIEFS